MLRESEKRLVFCLLERSGSSEQALCQSGKGVQGRCCGREWRTAGGIPPFIRHHLADSRQAC
ncbi:hypothetical protein CSC42_3293 [Pseudomonas aeruginosa]|nr:hypothetical protein CSC42_3293 [Pseudomonas aeruginosa]